MKVSGGSFLMAVMLAMGGGCMAGLGPHLWTKPGVAPEVLTREEYACFKDATREAPWGGYPMDYKFVYERCMRAKGYTRAAP